MGYNDVETWLNEARSITTSNTIDLKNSNDPTSLANIRASLVEIQRLNKYRTDNGISALNVDFSVMVGAMVNASYSATKVEHNPLNEETIKLESKDQFGRWGENIAYNDCVDMAAADPSTYPYGFTSQLVDNEKAAFDEAYKAATGTTLTPKQVSEKGSDHYLDDLSADQLAVYNSTLKKGVGHYINTVDPAFKSLGFAICSEYRGVTIGGWYKIAVTALEDFTNAEGDMTVEQALAKLDAYEDDLKNGAVREAKAALETAKAAASTAATDLETAKKTYENGGTAAALTSARETADKAADLVTSTANDVKAKQASLDEANKAVETAESGLATLKTKAGDAATAYNTAKDAADKASSAYTTAANKNSKAAAAANDAQSAYNTLKTAFDSKYGDVAAATAARDEAKKAADAADAKAEKTAAALATAKDAVAAAKTAANDASKAYNNASKVVDNAKANVVDKQGAADAIEKDLDAVTAAVAAVSTAQNNKAATDKAVTTAADAAQVAAAAVPARQAAYDSAKAVVAANQAQVNTLKNIDLEAAIDAGFSADANDALNKLIAEAHDKRQAAEDAEKALTEAKAKLGETAPAYIAAKAAYDQAVAGRDAAQKALDDYVAAQEAAKKQKEEVNKVVDEVTGDPQPVAKPATEAKPAAAKKASAVPAAGDTASATVAGVAAAAGLSMVGVAELLRRRRSSQQ